MERLKKVVKLCDNPIEKEAEVEIDDGGGERSDDELSDMDKLPSEILMKLLDYLGENQLVKCRLVSSRWNEICCLLLPNKSKNNPDSKLTVHINNTMCTTVIYKPIPDFLECFAPSEIEKSSGCRRPFPFSRFNFKSLQFDANGTSIYEFVSTFGPHMKTVLLYIYQKDIANFRKLWKLLLDFAPNIQRLGIFGDSCLKDVILFDPVVKGLNLNDTFLKNLKILEIVSDAFGEFNDFMKELLDNTPNLEEVSCVNSNYFHSHDFEYLAILQQLNKIHLFKKLEFESNFKSRLSPADLMKNLGIKKLRANCEVTSSNHNQVTTINYINHALKSSQNTLSTLDLYNLTIESVDLGFKDISTLPNVRQLKLQIKNSNEIPNILQRLSQLCPNTKNLDAGSLHREFTQVARILWTGFKALQSLKFSLFVDDEQFHPLILDSEFSGYSTKAVQRIQKNLNNGRWLEWARDGEKQKPSISDLKDLRELELDFIQAMDKRYNFEEDLKNSLFLKMLPKHHINKIRVLNFNQVFRTRVDSDSEPESDD